MRYEGLSLAKTHERLLGFKKYRGQVLTFNILHLTLYLSHDIDERRGRDKKLGRLLAGLEAKIE